MSPDGRGLAYQSDESGRFEVYVQPFPELGAKWQISTDGGQDPVWNPNGRELFYCEGDKMMAVSIETAPELTAGKPQFLFEGAFQQRYDVSRDGQRFLMVERVTQEVTEINVVFNWPQALQSPQ